MSALVERTISATEFKARCLELFDQLAARKLDRIKVTKRGRVVAVLTPPDHTPAPLHGFMRGSVLNPAGIDFARPILEEELFAESGRLVE